MDISLNKTINIIILLSLFDGMDKKNIYFCIKDAIDELVLSSKSENYIVFDKELDNTVFLINDYSSIDETINSYYEINFINKADLNEVVERFMLLSPLLKKSNTSFNCIEIDGNQIEIHFINSDLDIHKGTDSNYNYIYRKIRELDKKKIILFNKIIFQSRMIQKNNTNDSSTFSYFMSCIYILNYIIHDKENVVELANYIKWLSDYKLYLNDVNQLDISYISKYIVSKIITEENILDKDYLFYKKIYKKNIIERINL